MNSDNTKNLDDSIKELRYSFHRRLCNKLMLNFDDYDLYNLIKEKKTDAEIQASILSTNQKQKDANLNPLQFVKWLKNRYKNVDGNTG